MVAKIESGRSISGMLYYNEHKVQEGKAELLNARLYGRDAQELTFRQKLERLTGLAERNSRAKVNAVHISLNFAIGEKLAKDVLDSIVHRYMQGIGFGEQPCLIYQHFDAGHAHVHIATTNIQPDGTRIALHNLGRTKSEETRKAIEKEFNLVKAEEQQKEGPNIKPIPPEKILYGKIDTKRAISNVVTYLTRNYNVTSLAELNVLLRQFNVVADSGKPGTRLNDKGGLIYQVLDDKGERIGVPIKASSIYSQPTLKHLEEKFSKDAANRRYQKAMLKNTIDKTLQLNPAIGKESFIGKMKQEKVDVIFRENSKGKIFGLTFVDHKNKAVFKGSDVAEHYSASKLLNRLEPGNKLLAEDQEKLKENSPSIGDPISGQKFHIGGLLDVLLSKQQYTEPEDKHFKRKKHKHRL